MNRLNINTLTISSQKELIEQLKGKKIEDINFADIDKHQILEAMKLQPDLLAARMRTLVEKNALRDYDLSAMNLNILFVILTLQSVTQSKILEYVHTTPANLSQRIERLLSQQLIKVVNSKEDKRKKLLTLSRKGQQVTVKAIAATEAYKKKFAAGFSNEELAQYLMFHIKLAKRLEELESAN